MTRYIKYSIFQWFTIGLLIHFRLHSESWPSNCQTSLLPYFDRFPLLLLQKDIRFNLCQLQKLLSILHVYLEGAVTLKIDNSLQWCRQDFQLTGSECCFYPQNLKNPMEHWTTVICFSKIDGFENPPQKIDGFGRTRRTPSDDSTGLKFWHCLNLSRWSIVCNLN